MEERKPVTTRTVRPCAGTRGRRRKANPPGPSLRGLSTQIRSCRIHAGAGHGRPPAACVSNGHKGPKRARRQSARGVGTGNTPGTPALQGGRQTPTHGPRSAHRWGTFSTAPTTELELGAPKCRVCADSAVPKPPICVPARHSVVVRPVVFPPTHPSAEASHP